MKTCKTVHTSLSEHFCMGSHPTMNCIWGIPPILVKGSRDPSMRSQRHLYFNQHYSSAFGHFCYVLSTAGTSTASYWSGVFNLLKFVHTLKKRRFIK